MTMSQPLLLIALLAVTAIAIYLTFVVRAQERLIAMLERINEADDQIVTEAAKALRAHTQLYELLADRVVQIGEIKVLEADRAQAVVTLCELTIKEARAAIARTEATK